MTLEIPSEEDWGDYKSDLDAREAHKHFFGKSNEQVVKIYREDISMRATDLRFMPAKPFRYYMIGFKDFASNKSLDEFSRGEAASCFFRIIEYKLEHAPFDIIPIMDKLIPLIDDVAKNQASYDLPVSICGSYEEKAENIIKKYVSARP